MGICLWLLSQHIDYLNHLDFNKWGHRYLIVNSKNTEFISRLVRLKILVTAGWLCLFIGFYWHCKHVLKRKHMQVSLLQKQRYFFAFSVFMVSLVNYAPPDIELSLYFFNNSVCYGLIAICLYYMPGGVRIFTYIGEQMRALSGIPTWVIGCISFLSICVIGYIMGGPFFSHLPLTFDTNAELVHAKMILDGKWYMRSLPYREFYFMVMTINDGRWMSQYPPGHLWMLALGTYFERQTLVLPILGGLTTWATYWFAKELYGRYVARIALVLSGGCVYLMVMSSEFMMNGTSLLTTTLFLAAYIRMLKKPTVLIGLIGGAAIGYCAITRPYSALVVAAPFMVHAFYLLVTSRRTYWRALIAMGIAGGCFVALQLYWNAHTTGHAFMFGYERAWGGWHNPLSSEAAEKLDASMLEKNLRENLQRLAWFNRVIFEWPIPGLALVALLYGWRGSRREERLLYLAIFSMMISCQVLPGNVEREWGPRLMYEILTVLIVFSAKGLCSLPAFLRSILKSRRPRRYYYGLGAVLFMSMYWFTFSHNVTIKTLKSLNNFYDRGANPGLYHYIKEHAKSPALVFVPTFAYQAVSFANPPKADDKIIYVVDKGSHNYHLIRHYKNRFAYRAYFNRFGGYELVPYK